MRYVVITGASKGIGKAIAYSFLAKNNEFALALTYNTDKDGVYETALKLTERGFFVILVKMDISNPDEVKDGFDYIFKCFPRVDVLINNAGISLVKPFSDTSIEEWNNIVNVNLNGAFYTTKQVIDKMNYEGGVIFNITSIWGEIGASSEVAYSATKSGLIGFSKALAKEYPISVKAISVGFVDTAMNSHMTDEDIQRFLLENPEVSFKKPQEVGDKILSLALDELQKIESGIYQNDNNEPVVIRIW